MTQLVRITVHPFELHSALDRIHHWSSSWHWGTPPLGNPSFTIDLNVVPDDSGLAQKFTGDRFDLDDPFWFLSDEERASKQEKDQHADRILDMIRNRGNNAHSNVDSESDTAFSLMDHLKEKTRG